MAAPLMKRFKKVLNGFLFGPEIAQQFDRVRRKRSALLTDKFIDGRMARARYF